MSFAIFQALVLGTNNEIDLRILVPIVAVFALPSVWSISKANYDNEVLLNNQMQAQRSVFSEDPADLSPMDGVSGRVDNP